MKKRTGASGKNKKKEKPPLNIPLQTKWLLDFVNLGKKPGELSPPTLELSEERLKKDKKLPDVKKPDFSLLRFWPLPDGSGTYTVDRNGHIWKRSGDVQKPAWIGKAGTFPEIRLPLKEGIIISEKDLKAFNKDGRISGLWYELRSCLFYVIEEKGSNYFCDEFLSDYLNENPRLEIAIEEGQVRFIDHPLKVYQSILAYFANFYLNEKSFHPLLMQCPCCGRFWFKESKPTRGRPQRFCTSACEDAYNKPSNEWKNDIERKNRKQKRKHEELKRLAAFLKERLIEDDHIPEKEAEKQAHQEAVSWIFQQNKRMKDHQLYRSYH